MLKTKVLLIFALFAISAVTCFAQGFGNQCTPAGTWYGGDETSSAKYLMVVTPGKAGEFSLRFVQGFTPKVPRISEYSGVILKTQAGGWESFSIALLNADLTTPPTAPPPSIRAVHARIDFSDCDTLTSTIDFYSKYDWGKIPFVSHEFETVFKEGQHEIVEIYHRVPTTCEYCPAN